MQSPRHTLVVIPLSKMTYRFGMSAPLGYLLSGREHHVLGVFSCELTPELVRQHDFFIVELNWVTELFEFRLIAQFIRRHRPDAEILFGGLFAQQHYRKILSTCAVDLTIRGDAEEPLALYLDGAELSAIPNLVTRQREADITYRFESSAYASLVFSLDWFPTYRQMIRDQRRGMPHRLGAWSEDEINYAFPMVVTTKRCAVAHAGCDYCLGAHPQPFHGDAQLDQAALETLLRRLEQRTQPEYSRVSAYVLNDISNYDFSGLTFDLELFVEYDGPLATSQQVEGLRSFFHAFRSGACRLPASGRGIHDRRRDLDYRSLVELLERPTHEVGFLLYEEDRQHAATLGIDDKHAVYHLDVFDFYSRLRFDTYSDYGRAMVDSIDAYAASKLFGELDVRARLAR